MYRATYLKTRDCPEDKIPHWVDNNAPYAIGKTVSLTTSFKFETTVLGLSSPLIGQVEPIAPESHWQSPTKICIYMWCFEKIPNKIKKLLPLCVKVPRWNVTFYATTSVIPIVMYVAML